MDLELWVPTGRRFPMSSPNYDQPMEVSASCDVTLRDEGQELLLTASIPRRRRESGKTLEVFSPKSTEFVMVFRSYYIHIYIYISIIIYRCIYRPYTLYISELYSHIVIRFIISRYIMLYHVKSPAINHWIRQSRGLYLEPLPKEAHGDWEHTVLVSRCTSAVTLWLWLT